MLASTCSRMSEVQDVEQQLAQEATASIWQTTYMTIMSYAWGLLHMAKPTEAGSCQLA